jgi:hypothetical protein
VQGKILIKFVAASQVLIERLLYPNMDLPTYGLCLDAWTDILNLKWAQNTGRGLILALLQRRND